MAEQLTLLSLGVDLDALARRIGIAQERAGLSDGTCAATAGVSEERWRSWKSGTERPGVARMPKIADAVKAPVGWLMYDADLGGVVPRTETEEALNRSRRAASLLTDVIPLVEAVERIAAEVHRDNLPIVGGETISGALVRAADSFAAHHAIAGHQVTEMEGRS